MRVVKADQALSFRVVERQRVAQAVGTLLRRLALFDLEFQPAALIEPMSAPVKGKQKFKRMLIPAAHLSCHHKMGIALSRPNHNYFLLLISRKPQHTGGSPRRG